MANGKFGATPRSHRHIIRERAERSSLARAIGLSRGANWRDIASTQFAYEESERYAEESRWYYEQDEIDMERKMCDGLGYYSTSWNRSAYPDDDIDEGPFYDSLDYWDILPIQ